MEMIYRPLERWPKEETPAADRRSLSTFKAPWHSTMDKLDAELWNLEAHNIVLQVDVDESQIRLDGQLRSGAKVKSPRVILSFDSKHGPLSYPCDSCVAWRHNVRSIALALEALRAVDRYGVTGRAEQYRGWTKIAVPSELFEFTSDTAAKEFIEDLLDDMPQSAWKDCTLDSIFRRAMARAHPDSGGTARQFKLVIAAKERLMA